MTFGEWRENGRSTQLTGGPKIYFADTAASIGNVLYNRVPWRYYERQEWKPPDTALIPTVG